MNVPFQPIITFNQSNIFDGTVRCQTIDAFIKEHQAGSPTATVPTKGRKGSFLNETGEELRSREKLEETLRGTLPTPVEL